MTYITTPYTYDGASNCLKEEWASLLHEIVNSLKTSSGNTDNDEVISKRTHLTEEDDRTSYTHTLPLEYTEVPDLVIKDFGESIAVTPPQQKNRKRQHSDCDKGQPPNAPLGKNKSTSKTSKGRAASAARAVKMSSSKLVHNEDDDNDLDQSIVPSTTPKKRKRQTSATPPPTQPTLKRKRGISPPPATLPIDINDGFYDNTTTTPPLSDIDDGDDDNDDNDSYTVIKNPDGKDGIRELRPGQSGFTSEEDMMNSQDREDLEDDRIEPSQQVPQKDQIIT